MADSPPESDSETAAQPEPARGIRRVVYLVLAMLFLALGVVGILLPGLPTTPFLLVMSYFLVRSWPWLHDRVVNFPLVGGPIRDWREKRGVRKRVKIVAVTMVLLVVAGSLFIGALEWPYKAGIAGFAALGLVVIWRLPTIKDEG